MPKEKLYLWCDLETTGLNPEIDEILECSFLLTDITTTQQLMGMDVVFPLPSLRPVENWHPVVQKMHTENKLIYACRESQTSVAIQDSLLASAITSHAEHYKADIVLSGNSVHFDRTFLKQWMPCTYNTLHYRQLDVSSLKPVADLLGVPEYNPGSKPHRAGEDVKYSIAEFRYYCEQIKPTGLYAWEVTT